MKAIKIKLVLATVVVAVRAPVVTKLSYVMTEIGVVVIGGKEMILGNIC